MGNGKKRLKGEKRGKGKWGRGTKRWGRIDRRGEGDMTGRQGKGEG